MHRPGNVRRRLYHRGSPNQPFRASCASVLVRFDCWSASALLRRRSRPEVKRRSQLFVSWWNSFQSEFEEAIFSIPSIVLNDSLAPSDREKNIPSSAGAVYLPHINGLADFKL